MPSPHCSQPSESSTTCQRGVVNYGDLSTEQNYLQTMYFFSHYERYDPAVLNDFILELSLLFEAERRIKLQRNLTAFKHDHVR